MNLHDPVEFVRTVNAKLGRTSKGDDAYARKVRAAIAMSGF